MVNSLIGEGTQVSPGEDADWHQDQEGDGSEETVVLDSVPSSYSEKRVAMIFAA